MSKYSDVVRARQKFRRTAVLTLAAGLLVSCWGAAFGGQERLEKRFSLKVTFGRSYYFWGDINQCLESFNKNDFFEYLRTNAPHLISGNLAGLDHFANSWEAELRYDLSRSISICVATSPTVRQEKETSLVLRFGGITSTSNFKPKARVSMPVSLGACYTMPLIPRISLIFNSGLGVYSAKISQFHLGKGARNDGTTYQGLNSWQVAPKVAIGFRGGVGIEFCPTKNLACVMEVTGRYLRVDDLRGTLRVEGEAGIDIEKGTLYFYNLWGLWFPGRYDDLTIWQEPPWASISDITDIRKAVLDLTGYSLRIGIRTSLF